DLTGIASSRGRTMPAAHDQAPGRRPRQQQLFRSHRPDETIQSAHETIFTAHVDSVKQPAANKGVRPRCETAARGRHIMNTTRWLAPNVTRRGGVTGTTADAALVAAIAAGDRDAMRILYDRHRIRVFRFVARLVGDISVAEDVVSEAFIEAWRQAGRFEG